MVCDWRKLNSITLDDGYLMNNPAHILSSVAGARYLSKIDLKNAFYQIPLSAESRKYTSFRTFCGSYEYVRGGMGLKSMPKTFQRLINKILRGAQSYAVAHLDDITIFSKTFEEHLEHLRDVLMRLSRAKLTAQKDKSQFIFPAMSIFRHVVENGLIKPDE